MPGLGINGTIQTFLMISVAWNYNSLRVGNHVPQEKKTAAAIISGSAKYFMNRDDMERVRAVITSSMCIHIDPDKVHSGL